MASEGAYHKTTRRLLSVIDPTARIFTAHMEDADRAVKAPELAVADLSALDATLTATIEAGRASARGFTRGSLPCAYTEVQFALFGWTWNNG